MGLSEHKRVAITGAGSGVGEALALRLGKRPNVDLVLIGGRREQLLRSVGERVGAKDVIPGDILEPGSAAFEASQSFDGAAFVDNACGNLDAIKDKDEQARLRDLYGQRMTGLLDARAQRDPSNPQLLLHTNSVTQWFAKFLKIARRFPYMQTKLNLATQIADSRKRLEAAGVVPVVVNPTAIDTSLIAENGPDETMKLCNAMFGKLDQTEGVPAEMKGLQQDRVFQPDEVAGVFEEVIAYFLEHGTIPPNMREINLIASKDLQLQWPQ